MHITFYFPLVFCISGSRKKRNCMIFKKCIIIILAGGQGRKGYGEILCSYLRNLEQPPSHLP